MRHATKTLSILLAVLLGAAAAGPAVAAAAPDYAAWNALLARYYDPAKGMNYRALKAHDAPALAALQKRLAEVDPASLSRNDQLAYWINLYNVSVVSVVVERYPVESIRDISTDPIIRLNVFKKPYVKVKGGAVSLNDVENDRLREGFKDPRIHFAINCAALSCPPIRSEAYLGSRVGEQLDDQARRFLNGPRGVHLEKDGDALVVHATKIMDWFGEDFDKWGGGRLVFLKRYVSPEKRAEIDRAGGNVKLDYDDYSWKLNDASK